MPLTEIWITLSTTKKTAAVNKATVTIRIWDISLINVRGSMIIANTRIQQVLVMRKLAFSGLTLAKKRLVTRFLRPSPKILK